MSRMGIGEIEWARLGELRGMVASESRELGIAI